MADYSDLIARLEKAEGPDKEIDHAIMAAFHTRESRHIGAQEQDDDGRWVSAANDVWVDPATDKWVSTHPHQFTASLDAAIALTEKMLPGWGWNVERYGHSCEGSLIELGSHPDEADREWSAISHTPTIALLIATLKALQSLEQKDAA